MDLILGFIIWGIVTVVIGVLLFLFWKLFLCTRTGYESRKKSMGVGVFSIGLVFSALLFVPIFLTQSDDYMVSLIDGLREDTAVKANYLFEENIENELRTVIDKLIVDQKINMTAEIEERKETAIKNAIKYSRNKNFIETIEMCVQLFKVESEPLLNFTDSELVPIVNSILETIPGVDGTVVVGKIEDLQNDLETIAKSLIDKKHISFTPEVEKFMMVAINMALQNSANKPLIDIVKLFLSSFRGNDVPAIDLTNVDLKTISYMAVKPYADFAIKNEIKNISLKWFFKGCIETTSFGGISGVEPIDLEKRADKAVNRLLSKSFLIITIIIASIIACLIMGIILLLKEPKTENDESDKRKYLFEFDRMNKVTGKRISEELNQLN